MRNVPTIQIHLRLFYTYSKEITDTYSFIYFNKTKRHTILTFLEYVENICITLFI